MSEWESTEERIAALERQQAELRAGLLTAVELVGRVSELVKVWVTIVSGRSGASKDG